MKDLLSIQEFSKLSGIETSTLRYWDDIGLFSPVKRNPENNYRYYSPVQITALNFVTTLSDLELPLKTIAELRKERDPENFLQLLEKQERQMDMEMRRLRLRYSIIHARQELIRYGLRMKDNPEISILHRDNKAIIIWPRNEYHEDDTFLEPLTNFVGQTSDYHVNLSFPIGGYWNDIESFRHNPARPDHFFSIDPLGNHVRKAGNYLVGFSRGYYAELGELPERMQTYAKENDLALSGPVYTMYLHDEICTLDPSDYLAQTCVAVSPKKNR